VTARWLFPVDQPPLARGTLTIQGGRILAVDKAGARTADIDLGNAAILPGLVNAHTHLDLSDAVGRCPPTADFTAWLRAVIAHRRRQTPEDVARAIDIGVSQCLRYGTTLVGDIAADGSSWERLTRAPLRATVFYEMLGLTRERAEQTLGIARDWLAKHPDTLTCRAGLSPHAPYSVRACMFAALTRTRPHAPGTAEVYTPTAIHVAETEAEIQLLRYHQGPFVDFLRELGVWDRAGLAGDPKRLVESRNEAASSLFIHGNYLPPETDLGKGTLVLCPRTHATFGHKPHPFRTFLAKGSRVVLGTDSLASSPDLDILAEARFLHQQYPELPGETILAMATIQGATALTWNNETGSLAAGKSADLVVLPLPNAEPADPHALVLDAPFAVSAVVFRGELVYATDKGHEQTGALQLGSIKA
jgi:cytosine/adenosine deaminase-related metal-dependent hydrolase